MANKYKNVKIENVELKSTTIGAIKAKKTGYIPLILIFFMLIGFVVFMPYLTEYLENGYFIEPETVPAQPEENEEEEEEEVTENEYPYVENMSIGVTEITLSNITYSDGLYFTLKNNLAYETSLEKYNYYLDVYDTNETLVDRISFNDITLLANEELQLFFELNVEAIMYFKLVVITSNDYPEVSLSENENNVATMICVKEEEIKYHFTSSKLTSFESTATYTSDSADYDSLLAKYTSLADTYNSYNGVNATIGSNSSLFSYKVYFDLNVFDNSILTNDEYSFAKDTGPNEIAFKLELLDYKCE